LGADYLLEKQMVKRKAYLLRELKKIEEYRQQQAVQHPPPLPPKKTKEKKGRFLLTPVTQT
jgi:hypothetical protein